MCGMWLPRRHGAQPPGPASCGGRPGTGFAFSASFPPFRHFATHPNTVDRCSPAPRHILRMGATFDLRHRAQPQRLQRYVIQLPAVVVAHIQLSQITR